MIFLRHVLAVLFAFLAGAAFPAIAEEKPSPADLVTVENAIEQSRLRQKELDERRGALLKEEEALSIRLVAVARQVREEEQTSAAAAERIKAIQAGKAKIALDLAGQQDMLSEILAGLQRLEQNPPPALVVRPHDVLAALRSAMVFGTLAPELRQAAGELQAKLASLGKMEASLRQELAGQERALNTLAQARAEIGRLAGEKRLLAKSLNIDLEAEKRKSLALAEKAGNLRDLLDSIAAQEARAAEEESKAQAEKLAVEQRRKALAAIRETDFADQKGQLAYPAEGRIAKRFGDETGFGRPLDGIVIATNPAAAVTSPATGLVEFAGSFRSYGEMVIINPGGSYLILMAGLGQVSVSPGQTVKAGEPVAAMGEKPVAMALAKDMTLATTPMLYVEFRKNGEPVNPTPWWAGPQPQAASEIENQEAMR